MEHKNKLETTRSDGFDHFGSGSMYKVVSQSLSLGANVVDIFPKAGRQVSFLSFSKTK
jgi:hypothetical protein